MGKSLAYHESLIERLKNPEYDLRSILIQILFISINFKITILIITQISFNGKDKLRRIE